MRTRMKSIVAFGMCFILTVGFVLGGNVSTLQVQASGLRMENANQEADGMELEDAHAKNPVLDSSDSEDIGLQEGNSQTGAQSSQSGIIPEHSASDELVGFTEEVMQDGGNPQETDFQDGTEPLAETDGEITIDAEHFPDEIFREFIGKLGEGGVGQIDQNGDGKLSAQEREAVTDLSISSEPIKQLTGISYFPELRSISVYNSMLVSADFSQNTKIESINLSSNGKLAGINLNGCTNLNTLSVSGSALAELDLRNCTKLESLYCSSNKITSLDLSSNPRLINLDVSSNQLTGLKLDSMPNLLSLNCDYNSLDVLDVSSNQGLTNLSCSSNRLKSLDVTGLPELEMLNCSSNQFMGIDISKNSKLKYFYCSGNPLRKLDISQNPELENLDIGYTCIISLDTSNNKRVQISGEYVETQSMDGIVTEQQDGKWLLDLASQGEFQFGKMEIIDWGDKSNMPTLTEQGVVWQKNPVENGDIGITLAYDLSNGYFLDGKTLRCCYSLKKIDPDADGTYIELTEANFPDEAFRTYLKGMYDGQNTGRFQPGMVSELSIYGIEGLKDITGIEYFKVLSKLYVSQTPNLTKLDVSKNEKLTELYLDGTNINSLDLRNNPKIQQLNIYGNPVTSLYLAEGCLRASWLGTQPILVTAVPENGRYVVDFAEYGGLDANRIIELSDGKIEGNKIIWDSEDELPMSFSYRFLLYSDYQEGTEYGDRDALTVTFSLTNNAPELPEGKEIELTEENFPVPQLLSFLKENYDNDGDGKLHTREVTSIYLDGTEMASLKGIEHLDCLQYLNVYNASFNRLDVSSNPMLSSLSVNGSVTDVNIAGCPYLEEVDLSNNSISQIDVSKNRFLRTLRLNGNALRGLDVSQNSKLKTLSVWENALTGLDLSGCNQLQTLECFGNPRMTSLILPVQQKNIREINVSGSKLSSFSVSGMPNLEVLSIDSNQGGIKELDLSNNKKLRYLNVTDVSLKTDWTKMTSLEYLWLYNIQENAAVGKMDLSNAADLETCWVTMGSLKEFDVHGCTRLKSLTVNAALQKINVEGCTALAELDCTNNELVSLDVRGCTALKSLRCSNNRLATLDVTNNGALQTLYCTQNQLKTIDTSKNPALKWFECSDNPIISLDLSKNKAMLTDLVCMNASLTSLDAGQNEVLASVQLDNQVFKASAGDWQPESTVKGQKAALTQTGAANGSVRGADAGRIVLRLDKYGKFDPNRVTKLSSGKVVANGIMWESKGSIPEKVTYEYDVSNTHKLVGKTMPVTIQLGTVAPDNVISQQKLISSCSAIVSPSSTVYNGKEQKPGVMVKDGNKILKLGTDYTISYHNNKNAGTASMTIAGKGNYTGSVRKNFTIKKASQKISYTKNYQKAYGSKAFSIKVKRISGNGKLQYSSSNKKVVTVNGKGKVTIKGTGIATITVKAAATSNYNASNVKVTVKVNPKKQVLKSVKSLKGRKLSVSWKKDTKATGYQVQYSTSKNFKKGIKSITVKKQKTTSVTIKKLKAGKKYYVRVRSFKTAKLNGKKKTLYGTWSKPKRSGSIKK